MRILLGAAVILALAWGAPAAAVIIASGDGTGNTSAPADDPGFAHVGVMTGLSGVYIGDGWVLTARHVCKETDPDPCDVELEGVVYREVDGSRNRLLTDGVDAADLLLFQIESDPGLSPLPIATDPPAGELVMIGNGRNRGDPIYDWDGSPDLDGWYWGGSRKMRWGTNQVEDVSLESSLGGRTVVFTTNFSESGGTDHECQVATGDSGGAAFSKVDEVWELTGIHHARAVFDGQPDSTALFGNESWVIQLSDYRDQILDVIADPACSDGLDQDGDGLIDFPDDPGCDDALDAFETSDALPCDDGFDNDGDGGVDFDPETYADPGDETILPAGDGDPGCAAPTASTESPECQDGIHNDGDGKMDYDAGLFANGSADPEGPDPQCVDKPWRNQEAKITPTYACGIGAELALLLPALIWLLRRRA
jgi:hypothetical protein